MTQQEFEAGQLFREERRHRIVAIVNEKSKVLVSDLADQFDVTTATIRTDLKALEDEGLLDRTHGGAIAISHETPVSTTMKTRLSVHRKQKQKIAKEAVKLVSDGDFIMVDSGTTAQMFVHMLSNKRGLTILTNDIVLAHTAETELKDVSVIMLGGMIHNEFNCTEGAEVVAMLQTYYAPRLFFSCDAFSVENGFSTFRVDQAVVKRTMIEQSAEHIMLVDSSKIGNNAPIKFTDAKGVDTLITDNGITSKQRKDILAMENAPKLIVV